jgi:hypothetical protein
LRTSRRTTADLPPALTRSSRTHTDGVLAFA